MVYNIYVQLLCTAHVYSDSVMIVSKCIQYKYTMNMYSVQYMCILQAYIKSVQYISTVVVSSTNAKCRCLVYEYSDGVQYMCALMVFSTSVLCWCPVHLYIEGVQYRYD